MRRRLCKTIGLGNPAMPLLRNNGEIHSGFAVEMLETYFDKYEGFDFGIDIDRVLIGIEPTYQFDPLRIICMDRNINECFVWYGTAMGPYGSKIVGTKKFFKEYKRQSKFTRMVNKWHVVLFQKDPQ